MTTTSPTSMPLPATERSGGEQPAILLFGDSHSHAVHLAAEKRLAEQRPVPLAVFRQVKEKNGRQVGNISFDGFLKRISKLRPRDVVISAMGGSRHAVIGTAQHPQPFDFFTRDRAPRTRKDVEIIPYRVLQALFAAGVHERVGRRLKKVRSTTDARVVHLLPPPPKCDNAFIERNHEKFFAAQGLEAHGVSPPELRLKFWLLQARVMKKLCANLGVEVLMPPSSATEEGFLRPKYFAPDTTHANGLYGELVLELLERKFCSVGSPAKVD